MNLQSDFTHNTALERVCSLNWQGFDERKLVNALYVYYYNSVLFRENLEAALRLDPENDLLLELKSEELNTDNLSPFLGIAGEGEKLDHDEFFRRALAKYPISEERKAYLDDLGKRLLDTMAGVDDSVRAQCLASSEVGGAFRKNQAILKVPGIHWQSDALKAIRYFLEKHLEFDADGVDQHQGHGALVQSIGVDHRVQVMWDAFENNLNDALACEIP